MNKNTLLKMGAGALVGAAIGFGIDMVVKKHKQKEVNEVEPKEVRKIVKEEVRKVVKEKEPNELDYAVRMVKIIFGSMIIMSLMSKVRFKNFVYIGLLGIIAVIAMIVSEPYRIERIIAYVDPFSDPLGSGFQIIQSLFALSPGGILGKGINSSIQKHFYLPEPQTDFIFAIISEEYGLVGSLIIIILFGLWFYYGLNLSLKQKEYKYCLLIVGIISLIGVQVIINLGVVVGLLPVTGITLPFISYGGSSLIILDIGIGLLLNLAREENS